MLKIVEGGEGKLAALAQGVPYFGNTGPEHDMINTNAQDYEFIEIEKVRSPEMIDKLPIRHFVAWVKCSERHKHDSR